MTEKTMIRKGYEIKHSPIGWWVDGACGYGVAGYYDTKAEAVAYASQMITQAKKSGERPAWYID